MFPSIVNRLLYRSHPLVMVNLLAGLLLLLLRVYEFTRVLGVAPDGWPVGSMAALAVLIDVLTYGGWMVILSILYLLLSSVVRESAAMKVHLTLLAFTVAVAAGVSHYFTVTLIPLGTDLYGYSVGDIIETVSASGGSVLFALFGIILLVTLIFFLPRLALRFPAPKPVVLGFYALGVAAFPLLMLVEPKPSDLPAETAYHLVENKTAAFAASSVRYFSHRLFGTVGASETEYPLLHEATYEDVLGPYLTPTVTPPNVVIIIVEGLGKAFTDGGTYQGFTPFIDSLARTNLSWTNFLSTTGRTFGVLPSLTASLPFAPQGMMELGDAMPEHRSLYTLMKSAGYRTAYYYGGAIRFDKQNVFLERQKVDDIIDEAKFPASFVKAAANEQGFSWGYSDGDLFRYSLERTSGDSRVPRLDVYMTLTTHEPFIPPHADEYLARAERITASLSVGEEKRDRYRKFPEVFSTLLYLDDALRGFFDAYKKRADYANTIFIITGDHRLIPIPMDTRMDRYRVPFIIASPLVKGAHTFRSVSTHADVTPTLLGLFKRRYRMDLPANEHWIGTTIDTATEFRNIRSRAFMPYKGEISEYIDGRYFLSGDRLFTLNENLYAEETTQDSIRDLLKQKRDAFVQLCEYVTTKDKIMPALHVAAADAEFRKDDSLFAVIDRWGKNSDQLFQLARDTAFHSHYEDARVLCRRLLKMDPDYHDVRTLMASTYAWEKRYDEARREFAEVIRRSPRYADAHFGLARVEYWNENMDGALAEIDKTIQITPSDGTARVLRAKVLFQMGRTAEGLKELHSVLRMPNSPALAEAKELKRRYE